MTKIIPIDQRVLGVTGTQRGRGASDIERACRQLVIGTGCVITGGCIGVDAQVAIWFATHDPGIPQRVYLPSEPRAPRWKRGDYYHGEPFGSIDLKVIGIEGDELARNRAIVRDCTELLAMPYESCEIRRSGTWATIRHARKLDRPIHLETP